MNRITLIAAACMVAGAAQAAGINRLPAGVRGPISAATYDGIGDDLLTAGLGKTGLMGATPVYANPAAPTAAELRRNAIYVNYRALVDYTAAGGMGVFYGPNIDANGGNTLGEGKIAGKEFIAWADDGSGTQNVTLMVQVPAGFDPAAPCIVSATSSGSRGVYGAIATAGEWGLKRGCAVAYADKGSGNGLHDLVTNAVQARDGTPANAATVGTEAIFKAPLGDADRAAFNAATPNRVAVKHAHSQQNPEKDWGAHTLQAIRYAFYELNNLYGKKLGKLTLRTLTPENTLVIASSVSNGGGAALAAAEQDREGLIDGVAVSEPNAQPANLRRIAIQQGSTPIPTIGRPLVDYFTHANVYQPCAMLSAQAGLSLNAAFWPASFTTIAQLRCGALAAKGLVQGATLAEQADAALAKLRAYGWQADSDYLHQSHFRFATNSIAVTYTNSYGRFSVLDNLCGFSFANTDAATGAPVAQNAVLQAQIFANGNGVPPTSGVNIVYNPSLAGPVLDFVALSPSTGNFDFALDGALCQRSLVSGVDAVTGAPLEGELKARSERVQAGIAEVQLNGRLRGKPTLIVAGRNDALLPINHTARAYFAKTQALGQANVRYLEVTNAQHFDGFIAFGALMGYDNRYIPLHVYFNRAMDAMWAHLKSGAALPASQVVRTVPRGGALGAAPALAAANVPPVPALPAAADAIGFSARTLTIPD